MASNSSKSTTITFAIVQPDGASTSIDVQLDDAANDKKNTFQPGDTANFLIFTNPPSLAVTVDTTMGTVTANGTKSVPVKDQLQFVKSKEESLSYLPAGAVTTAWIGRSGGVATASGDKITLPVETSGVLDCSYNTSARAYKLTGVTIPAGLEEIQVLIVVSPTV